MGMFMRIRARCKCGKLCGNRSHISPISWLGMVPLGGLEPPHLAPEASALSSELQGQQWFNIATGAHKFQVLTIRS